MNTLEYSFEELPLFTDLGFSFAPVSGVAEISFDTDGTWLVTDIRLEGSRLRSRDERMHREMRGYLFEMYEYKWQTLCRESYPWLWSAIVDALEGNEYIQDKVSLALSDEGIFGEPFRRILNRATERV